MTPYSGFLFFGLSLYVVLPTIILGLFGNANARWALAVTVIALFVLLTGDDHRVPLTDRFSVEQIWLVLGYAVYQACIALALQRWPTKAGLYTAVFLSVLPLVANKVIPLLPGDSAFGFLGISYVTFRALDVVFSIGDRLIKSLSFTQYFAYLFFFPTVSSGPIDRYKRFSQDWAKQRNRSEFLDDLDAAIQRVFQGFLYKFILAALINTYWMGPLEDQRGAWATLQYMYAYTAYLFFDFAGYSAFAIGFSRLLGFRTPENFDRPFLSRNIREFWTRWHMSLSFWFRDHVYMRFLLAAGKGKWFQNKNVASYVGLFLTFGLMGIWHGLEVHYIIYGLYHAALLCGYDVFARWNKQRRWWPDGRGWRVLNILLTCHAFAFSLLIFSGRLSPKPLPAQAEIVETLTCEQIAGWVWDQERQGQPLNVDIFIDDHLYARLPATGERKDLQARGFGEGRVGFTFAMPEYLRDGRSHRIELKVVETGRVFPGTPREVTCDSR